MRDNCIILVTHIANKSHATILEQSIDSIRKHSPEHPILVCATGQTDLIEHVLRSVEHHILTSINTLNTIDTPLNVWYKTPTWTMAYRIQAPRYYYGFAQLQKTALALQGAMILGYKHFLVMNYDTLLLEDGFTKYMFSEPTSIFFNFLHYPSRMSSDVFKLNIDSAKAMISLASDEQRYHEFASKFDGFMLEDILGEMLTFYNISFRKFIASSTDMFQLHPFKVLVNNSYNEGAMAAVIDGVVHLLITNQGHPRHTLDGKLEIGYNGKYTAFDVSMPISILFPLTEYKHEDIDFSVRTSFGEVPVTLSTRVIDNSEIIFH